MVLPPSLPPRGDSLVFSGGESVSFDDIMSRLNSDTEQQKYTKAELTSILRCLEADNQVSELTFPPPPPLSSPHHISL
jgi:hypothetical protein